MVKFSVIIPVYNAAHTIRRCVKSIMDNSFKDLEVILVEDGSVDNSWEVCCELETSFGNVKALKNEKNKGVSYTRNKGLECAKGQYIMFVDSDDWIEANYYEEFNNITESYNTKLVICGYVNHDEKQNRRTDEVRWDNFVNEKEVEAKKSVLRLYEECLLQQLWNKAFLASIIQKYKIKFDESISIGEDLRFVLDYLRAGQVKSIVLVNKVLYHYMRDQEGSLMYRVGYESVEEPLKNRKKLYEFIGLSLEEIDKKLRQDREKQIELYAYLIMHNAGMKQNEKRRLILDLDVNRGKALYQENMIIYIKEIIAKWIKKS